MLCQNCKVASQIAFTFCIDVFTGHFHKSFLYAIFKIIHLLSEEFLLFCVIKSPLYTPACFKTDIGSTTADSTAVDYQTWVIHSGVAGFYHRGGGGGGGGGGGSRHVERARSLKIDWSVAEGEGWDSGDSPWKFYGFLGAPGFNLAL